LKNYKYKKIAGLEGMKKKKNNPTKKKLNLLPVFLKNKD
jgi:hypothetical protein